MPSTEEKLNWPVVIVIIIGTFMAILDGTIVNVALPKMMNVFNASPDRAQWIVTAYMLCLGVVMPVSGYLGDRFGYKRIYWLALLFFVIGSTLCGLAWSIESMIVARVIQALGGGIMQPLGMAILYKNFPKEKMGMVLGVWGIAIMAAPAVGPTLGGYLVDYINWRMIFYVNIPVGVLNLFLASMILKETASVPHQSFDKVGLLCSTVGFFCLLLAISQSTVKGWNSPYIVFLFYVALLALGCFIYNELHHPDPILDLRLFRNFVFSISVIIGSIISIGMFGAIFLLPLFLQRVLGQTAMQTGLIMFPAAFASGLMMPISGRIFDKYGARWTVIFGLAIVVWTTYMMGTFNANTSFAAMTIWFTLRGFGMGFCFMPVTTAGMNTVPLELVGRASALNNVIRQVASAFGIALFTGIMQSRQAFHAFNYTQAINPGSVDFMQLQQAFKGMVLSGGPGGDAILQSMLTGKIMQMSMIQAINDCFLIAALLCGFALLLSFFLRDRR